MQNPVWTQRFSGALPPRSFRAEGNVAYIPDAAPSSAVISVFVVALISGFLMASSEQFNHWLILPVSGCGMLIGIDAVDWLRGKLDVYDPVGVVGLFGTHFFYIAPLLHIRWGLYIGDVAPPPDWRDWLGAMAVLNFLGLVAYRVCRARSERDRARRSNRFWEIDRSLILLITPVLLVVAAIAQFLVYTQFGGIDGYMNAAASGTNPFGGMGWIFMISESFPILSAIFVITIAREREWSWPWIGAALLSLIAIQSVFGGLRGSRSQTVSALFWVVGCVHFFIRPVSRKVVAVGCIFLMLFMYFYGFYKSVGTDAMQAFNGADERAQLSQRTGRTFESALLGDLGRADVQAYVLYRLWKDPADVRYAWGRTYVAAVSLLIPRSILPTRPETILREGTEIQSGPGTYVPEVWWSTRVYGIGGEAMLNFGAAGVPVAYGILGIFLGRFRRAIRGLSPGDARLLLAPFGVYLAITALGGDSDNFVFGAVKDGLIPGLLIWIATQKRPRADAAVN
jgi:hypothetical protein